VEALKPPRPDYAENYHRQLVEFVREQFNADEAHMCEAHVMAFLEYCLTRPRRHSENGRLVEAPICNGLPNVVSNLSAYYREIRPTLITARTWRFAESLRDRYGPAPRKATALTPGDARAFVAVLDRRPHNLRTKAAFLLLCTTWRRPSEFLWLDYPQCVRAGYDRGIVLVVPKNKTNPREPRLSPILHTKDRTICPVCALREWLDFLGRDYRGPLFPTLCKKRPRQVSLRVGDFTETIQALARRTGRPPGLYGSYSLRRGGASTAAALGWDLEVIQRQLWHKNVSETLQYIDPDVLTRRTRSVLQ
jgi:hypothetical protein